MRRQDATVARVVYLYGIAIMSVSDTRSNVVLLREPKSLSGELQDELYAVILKAKYDGMQLSQTVGVLEFLKWNLINQAC